MKKQIISFTLVAAGFLIGATALTALADWSSPTNPPPSCPAGSPGCDAPINVGSSAQGKLGALAIGKAAPDTADGYSLDVDGWGSFTGLGVLGNLSVTGTASTTNLVVSGAMPGQVLVAADSNGTAQWQTLPSAAGWTPVPLNSSALFNSGCSYRLTAYQDINYTNLAHLGPVVVSYADLLSVTPPNNSLTFDTGGAVGLPTTISSNAKVTHDFTLSASNNTQANGGNSGTAWTYQIDSLCP